MVGPGGAQPIVLIVDDQPTNIAMLAAVLEEECALRFALNGEDALRMVASTPVDLILLDVVMPGMDGHAVCRQLKADKKSCDIPIIFVTSNRESADEILALELEAVDFIAKPFVASVVRARVMTHLGLLYTRARLVEAEKQAALGQLVAGVAHEINTPVGVGITAISELEERTRAFVALVGGEGISEEDLQNHIVSTQRLSSLIHDSLDRVSELVCRFKSLAVGQAGEALQSFEIKPCLESAVRLLCHEPGHARLFVTISCAESLTMRSYPGVLSRIVLNLLHHSRTHSFLPDQEGHVSLEVNVEKKSVRIGYRDDGQGMSGEACRCIFDPFHDSRLNHGRYGLGMPIVFNLVTRILGGAITCDGTSGQGVCFEIVLPRHSLETP